jgi:hypothetical protein
MPIKACPKSFDFKEEGRGTVHKEELVEHLERDDKDYHKLAQLLEWEDGEWSIRLGYYLKPHGTEENEWHWGAQTTFIISIESIDDLIKALASLKKTHERMRTKR